METLKEGSAAYIFCEIPLALADATLTVNENGQAKLRREQVMSIYKVEKKA